MAFTKIRANSQIIDGSIGNVTIATNAGIELTKIQDGALLVKSNGTVAFTAPIAGVAPLTDADLTTKGYVDAVATGLTVKDAVRAISVEADIPLLGLPILDGIQVAEGDRVLVTSQTDPITNGIYIVTELTAWARSADTDGSEAGEVTSGMYTFVEEGDVYGGSGWVLSTENPITVGTTPLTFGQFSSSGSITAGAGLNKVGNVLDVVSANAGIVSGPDSIALQVADTTLVIDPALGLKLVSVPEGQILVGNAAGVATPVVMTGDIEILATGATAIVAGAVGTAEITNGSVTPDKLSLAPAGSIIVTSDLTIPTWLIPTGDVTISDSGVFTIADGAVTAAKITDGTVPLAKLESSAAPASIIVANATNVPTYVVASGDATISDTGVITLAASIARVANFVVRETPAGLVNDLNDTFTLANVPVPGTEHVYVNGLLQDPELGADYTIDAEGVITFTYIPTLGDKVRVSYFSNQ